MNHYAGKHEFVSALHRLSIDVKQSSYRALKNCAAIHKISVRQLSAKLLEDAILREAQAHNPTIPPVKK